MEEFINHAKDLWHDELIISRYFNYIDEKETSKIIKFIEYNKNKLTRGNSDLEIKFGSFYKRKYRILLTSFYQD